MSWEPFLAFEGIEGSSDKNGVESIAVPYFVPTIALARRWEPEELLRELGLPIIKRSFNHEWGNGRLIDLGKDGAYRVTFGLEGVADPSDSEQGVQFDGDGTMSEEEADVHPDLLFLMEKYSGRIEDGKLVFDTTQSVGGGEEVKNELYGWKKYYVPGITWTKTYVTTRPSPTVTERLGKVDEPPRALDGYLPELTGRRNWLKVIGKPSWRGNVWKVTESWLMSGVNGWNRDVYR